MRVASFTADTRHARLTLRNSEINSLGAAVRKASLVGFVGRLFVQLMSLSEHRLPAPLREACPLVSRLLALLVLAVDTASLCAQIRVEVAGLRGLLALIEWARLRPELLIARRLQVMFVFALSRRSLRSRSLINRSLEVSHSTLFYTCSHSPHISYKTTPNSHDYDYHST